MPNSPELRKEAHKAIQNSLWMKEKLQKTDSDLFHLETLLDFLETSGKFPNHRIEKITQFLEEWKSEWELLHVNSISVIYSYQLMILAEVYELFWGKNEVLWPSIALLLRILNLNVSNMLLLQGSGLTDCKQALHKSIFELSMLGCMNCSCFHS